MRVIITRPLADAGDLAAKLAKRGHTSEILPLLAIVPRKQVIVPTHAYQAICLTSANGLSILAEHKNLAAIPVIAVGPQSASAASAAGFAHVEAHGGNVEGLCRHIAAQLSPGDGPLLYVSGAATSGDLAGQLAKAGFTVERVIAYDAVAQELPHLRTALSQARAVMLYSPRSAELWKIQVENQGQQSHIGKLMHVCLSAAVAQRLPQSWQRCVAAEPSEDAILAALDRCQEAE
jgi:uroporphyrinogen-III synthase